MRQDVAIAIYANRQGRVSDKGYLPAQLGCAVMVKVWVEKHIIEANELNSKVTNMDWDIRYTEGRGFLLEVENKQWTYCLSTDGLYKIKESVMSFIDEFKLKDSNCDFALEIVTVGRSEDDYRVKRWGNHMYAIGVEHNVKVSDDILYPLTLDESHWIGERG